jgi:hypothetical protein
MKKILLTFAMILLTISLMAQKTQYYDLIIQKTTPLLHLYGSGGIINWNNGDLLLTHTTNTLTLSGGDFLLGTTYSLGIGATTPLHKLVVVSARANNLNALNIVNSDLNKNRTSTTQARDTSSLNLWYSYTGAPLLTMTGKAGEVLFRADSIGFGVGTATPLTKLSVISSTTTNLNAFNFVNSDLNKTRTTFALATDTSSVNLAFTATGSPRLRMIGKTGLNLFVVDSVNAGFGTATPLHRLTAISTIGTNLNAFNFVNNTTNKNVSTAAQSIDSSSVNLAYTYTGSPTFNIVGKTGNSLFHVDSVSVGLGTTTPQHKLAVVTSSLTKLNAFNFVNTINKRRDDPQQAADSSSFNLSFTTTGSPMLSLRNKAGANLLYIDSAKLTTTLDIGYGFKHAVGSADSVNWSTGAVQNWYYKINTGLFSWRENVGFTVAGDSIRILTAGDYKFHIWLNATTSNANDQMKVKMWVNNAQLETPLGMFKINSNGTGNGEVHYFMYYRTMAANDYVCFRICNLTAARASVISDYKLYVEKVPE